MVISIRIILVSSSICESSHNRYMYMSIGNVREILVGQAHISPSVFVERMLRY